MKLKILTFVMAGLMVIGVVAFAVTGKLEKKTEENIVPVEYSYENSEYTAKVSSIGESGKVYLPTDKDGLYYTATMDNEIKFWNYSDGGFTKASYETKKATFKLSATYESIPVTVTYIEVDGLTIGYGVFTAKMDSSVDVYDYAFVKVAKAPKEYNAKSGYLLLADFNKSEHYKADKTFSEIYVFNTSGGSVSTILSNNTRLIDRNGGFRQDWSMLTDEFLSNIGSAKYFMSSRYYTEEETGIRTDIMVYSNAYRPTIVAEDIVGTWFVNDSDGIHYLRNTDDGFESVVVKDEKTKSVAKFEGDFAENYLRCGNYIVNKNSGEMTDVMTGKVSKFSGVNLQDMTIFVLSADGNKAVFASEGKTNENGTQVQSVAYCTADGSKEAEVYSEPMLFDEGAGFTWLGENSVMSVRASDASGSTFASIIYNY